MATAEGKQSRSTESRGPIEAPSDPSAEEEPLFTDVSRTELVWPGKYDEHGRRPEVRRGSLPFQVIETINENRATRQAKADPQPSLFDVWQGNEGDTLEEGWKNKLIWGDNLLVLGALQDKFAGKFDLIYIDPPFATGADFRVTSQIGDSNLEVAKQHSIIEEKAYRDTWGANRASWFDMIAPRLVLMRDLLAESGTIYVHMDWYVGHHLRVLLDEIFGESNSLGEIVWGYGSPSGGRVSGSKLVKSHDIIFAYAKRYGKHKYSTVYLPYSEKYVADWFKYEDEDGRRYRKRWRRDKAGESYFEKQYLDESKGVPASTVWTDIQQVYADPRAYRAGMSSDITGYPTQKPRALLERILNLSTVPGDLVGDFFMGSGTTVTVAEKAGRRWIGCDLSRFGIHVSRKRLLGIDRCGPFEILNLGKYERQFWQAATFGEDLDKDGQIALYEYLAFILKLYGGEPLSGSQHLHGRRDSAVIHIGAVDAPVTIDEIAQAIDECVAMKQDELHILGWEWEMGLAGPDNGERPGGLMHEIAKKRGVKLLLRHIPREVMEDQAVDSGDIRFFELAYLDVVIDRKKRDVTVTLKDFVIPNTELIPEEVRQKIEKWSDYVDYWAVDWDFQNDTFIQGWVDYRTRADRSLALTTDPHRYEAPGSYRILVKVVDIFGNDTSQAYDIEVQ